MRKNTVKKLLAVILSIGLAPKVSAMERGATFSSAVGGGVLMAEAPPTPALIAAPDPVEQEKWRQKLKSLQGERDTYYTLGVLGAVGGVALTAAGYAQMGDAENIQGCQRTDFFTITCDTEQATNQANDKLDKGRGTLLVGTLVLTLGIVGIFAGSSKADSVRSHERKGKRNGFTVSLAPGEKGQVQLTAAYAF